MEGHWIFGENRNQDFQIWLEVIEANNEWLAKELGKKDIIELQLLVLQARVTSLEEDVVKVRKDHSVLKVQFAIEE